MIPLGYIYIYIDIVFRLVLLSYDVDKIKINVHIQLPTIINFQGCENFHQGSIGQTMVTSVGTGGGVQVSGVWWTVFFLFSNGQKRLRSSKSLGLKIATLQKLAVLPVLPFTLYKRCSFCWGVSGGVGEACNPWFFEKTKR